MNLRFLMLLAPLTVAPAPASGDDASKSAYETALKDLATIAGAAGGAYAGHKIEGKMNKIKTWSVSVRFDNGDEHVYNFDHDPAMLTGDLVKASGASIVRR